MQHYSTYEIKERDIGLSEYEMTGRTLESEAKIFTSAANIALVAGAGIVSLATGKLAVAVNELKALEEKLSLLFLLLIVLALASYALLRYFADRHKSIVYAARKLVVLRRMLGISYGQIQLVLPRWRVEGAENPHDIVLFPGWKSYIIYPFISVAIVSTTLCLMILYQVLFALHVKMSYSGGGLVWLTAFAMLYITMLLWIYRSGLYDIHENALVLIARLVARFLRVRILENYEEIIYRARLAYYEAQRLKYDIDAVYPILLHIEDKSYYSHWGVSIKGMVRAALSALPCRTRMGGSTITQQFVRTLFIVDVRKVFRRKIIEIIMALAVTSRISKKEMLMMYIESVRFGDKVFGMVAAMKHFWGMKKRKLTQAEAFFLVERLSMVNPVVRAKRVAALLNGAIEGGVLSITIAEEVLQVYSQLQAVGKIYYEDENIKNVSEVLKINNGRIVFHQMES